MFGWVWLERTVWGLSGWVRELLPDTGLQQAEAGCSARHAGRQQCSDPGSPLLLLPLFAGGQCCPYRRGEWWLRLSTDFEHMNK